MSLLLYTSVIQLHIQSQSSSYISDYTQRQRAGLGRGAGGRHGRSRGGDVVVSIAYKGRGGTNVGGEGNPLVREISIPGKHVPNDVFLK